MEKLLHSTKRNESKLQDPAGTTISSLFSGNMAQPEIIFTTEEKFNSLKYSHSETKFWAKIIEGSEVDNTRTPVSCAASRTLL
ncbi:hypothetical protein PRIPAC_91153 [Pristionchus pacificus]|uniref:Uncharacterized protein n=1 Tax=Pristionchus pacificus TaxID=54126 RepID=A0A2A6CVI7_PRIPA|nr:hypothetical protein PRIPAC_91153 [Pristionchus pacificus]|eukprot:PDM82242.1 hypothetical protein PRIPAC_36635 [Pristionchus pacificus]